MKSEKIIRALGDIDDRLVMDIIPIPVKKRKQYWPTILMGAAMLGICVFGALKLDFRTPSETSVQPEQSEIAQVTEQVMEQEAEQIIEKLPMLTLGSSYAGDGWEMYDAYDASQLVVGNPMDLTALPETLPVYENVYYTNEAWEPDGWLPDQAMMETVLQDVAEQVGIDGEIDGIIRDEVCYSVSMDEDGAAIYFECDMDLLIYPDEPIVMPEVCGSQTLEQAEEAALYLLETYGDRLGMEAPAAVPVCRMYTNQGQDFDVVIYDSAGKPADQLRSFCLQSVRFYLYENAVRSIHNSCKEFPEVVGEYPILSYEEACNLWTDGYGLSKADGEPIRIAQAEIVYRDWTWMDYYIPYYRFLVEMQPDPETETDLNRYGVYYLPAVRPEYLEDQPRWLLAETATESGWELDPTSTTEEYLLSLVVPLEIAMANCGEFTYSEYGLTADQMFMAFLTLSSPEELEQFVNAEGTLYTVPEDAVTEKLANYFPNFIFHETDDMIYDIKVSDGAVSWPVALQITGNRYARVLETEIDGDTVTFLVGYYANAAMEGIPYVEKSYSIGFYDGGYRYGNAAVVAENQELLVIPGDPIVDVPDEVLLDMVLRFEVGLTNQGFTFRNACELNERNLYTMFLLLADWEEEIMPCYEPETEEFVFTEALITDVLSKYLIGFTFDIAKAPGYDAELDKIVTTNASGFGGDRAMKILNKEVVGNYVIFKAGFYGSYELQGEPYAVKEYTIAFRDDGYCILSAIFL